MYQIQTYFFYYCEYDKNPEYTPPIFNTLLNIATFTIQKPLTRKKKMVLFRSKNGKKSDIH